MSLRDRAGRLTETARARVRMGVGVEPLSSLWAADRGQPIHRRYLEQFLTRHAADVRGRCLEFNDGRYLRQFGGDRVTRLDVMHLDDTNREATIVADLTRPNTVEDARFDCIVATHVLHIVFDLGTFVRELHRILAPGGVLLVAVPGVSMAGPAYPELWRFTPLGLERTLRQAFEDVEITPFGNSLAAAAELRGLAAHELRAEELDVVDPRFTVEVCARAVRR